MTWRPFVLLLGGGFMLTAPGCVCLDWQTYLNATTAKEPCKTVVFPESSYTTDFEFNGYCTCSEDAPWCHSLYSGRVDLHGDWSADLSFRKEDNSPLRAGTIYNIMEGPSQPRCTAIEHGDFPVLSSSTITADQYELHVEGVPIWPSQEAYDAAPSGDSKRVFLATSGYDSDGKIRWFQRDALTFTKVCGEPQEPFIQWAKAVGSSVGSVGAIDTDVSGNVWVVGGSSAPSAMTMAKLDAEGEILWTKRFETPSLARFVGVSSDSDSSLDATVVGYASDTVDLGGGELGALGGYDVILAHFTPHGEHIADMRIGGGPTLESQEPKDVATNSGNNVFLVGTFGRSIQFTESDVLSAPTEDSPLFIAKYDSVFTLKHEWSKPFGQGKQTVARVAASDDRAIFVGDFGGTSGATIDFGGGPLAAGDAARAIFVAALDADGEHVWSRSFFGEQGSSAVATGIALKRDGHVVVTGSFRGALRVSGELDTTLQSAGLSDGFVMELDAEGAALWAAAFGGPGDDSLSGVGTNTSGHVIVAGYLSGSKCVHVGPWCLEGGGDRDVFVAKLRPNDAAVPDVIWAARWGGEDDQEAADVAVDNAGYVVVAGTFSGLLDLSAGPLQANGDTDAFVIRLLP